MSAGNAPRRPLLRTALAAMLWPALCLPPRRAHAGLDLLSNEFSASRDELQAELARRFPITRRYGDVATVSLHDPRLSLDGAANRATLASHLTIVSPWLRPSPVGGEVAVSSGLRWDAAGPAVRLQNPRTEHLRIDGVSGGDAQALERISAAVVQEALQGYPLHTFEPQQLPFGLTVKGVTIVADAIKVQFE